jgi:hypothetical protein
MLKATCPVPNAVKTAAQSALGEVTLQHGSTDFVQRWHSGHLPQLMLDALTRLRLDAGTEAPI